MRCLGWLLWLVLLVFFLLRLTQEGVVPPQTAALFLVLGVVVVSLMQFVRSPLAQGCTENLRRASGIVFSLLGIVAFLTLLPAGERVQVMALLLQLMVFLFMLSVLWFVISRMFRR